MWPLRRNDHDELQPPLAGRLVGLAVGVLLLAVAVYVGVQLVSAVLPALASLAVLVLTYLLILGKLRR